jgi:hypothetical protein
VKLFIKIIFKHILYVNNERNSRKFDYTPGLGLAVTWFYLAPLGEAGLLTQAIMFNNNSFSLQGM